MSDTPPPTFDEVEAFLAGTAAAGFAFMDANARYAQVQTTLIRSGHAKRGRGVRRRLTGPGGDIHPDTGDNRRRSHGTLGTGRRRIGKGLTPMGHSHIFIADAPFTSTTAG
ncbi:MAG: hypothetical protein NTX45_30070 [Proteobacteria bacterium]|nr:hypothetical protein [Pseudomonadota bacterium]